MDAVSTIRVSDIYRYPVKGLSPERMTRAELEAGEYFPGDRLYAIENGPSGFDAAAPKHLPKVVFLMLMRNEALASLRTRFDQASHRLTIAQGGAEVLQAMLSSEEGRVALSEFMTRFMPDALRGEPRVLAAPAGYRFTDTPHGFVSLVNRASVRAVEDFVGAPVDPLRFRANLYLDGLEAWAEHDLSGRVFETPGGLRLKLTTRTPRCAATNVDPETGLRDLAIPKALSAHLGHIDCGIYAEVVASGIVREGDALTPVD